MILATLAAGAAGSFIGHHLAATSAYVCHPRCGADYPLRLERLTAAMQAGKTRIVAGVEI